MYSFWSRSLKIIFVLQPDYTFQQFKNMCILLIMLRKCTFNILISYVVFFSVISGEWGSSYSTAAAAAWGAEGGGC